MSSDRINVYNASRLIFRANITNKHITSFTFCPTIERWLRHAINGGLSSACACLSLSRWTAVLGNTWKKQLRFSNCLYLLQMKLENHYNKTLINLGYYCRIISLIYSHVRALSVHFYIESISYFSNSTGVGRYRTYWRWLKHACVKPITDNAYLFKNAYLFFPLLR